MSMTLQSIILEGENKDNLKDIVQIHYPEFNIFKDIYLYSENKTILILENKDVIISLSYLNFTDIKVAFLDYFEWNKGIYKELACESFQEEKMIDFIQNKKHPMFLHKKNILKIMEEYGIDTEIDLIKPSDTLTLPIEDIICIIKDAYTKGIKNIKK